jgi:alkylation response protein AidB-like acyl-CoA dehydrogenase
MTMLREREHLEVLHTPVTRHVAEWTLGIVGVAAGLIGLYMYAVPADWILGGLVEGWWLAMFMAAGILIGAALAMFARKAYLVDGAWTGGVTSGTVFSMIAFAAAVVFLFVWIL